MPKKQNKIDSPSLVERLLKVYELSSQNLDFSEVKPQEEALRWVSKIMSQLEQNEQRQKRNDR